MHNVSKNYDAIDVSYLRVLLTLFSAKGAKPTSEVTILAYRTLDASRRVGATLVMEPAVSCIVYCVLDVGFDGML